MTSVPKVYPGDTVFWHCDVVHSVEEEHTGKEISAGMFNWHPLVFLESLFRVFLTIVMIVMYIPAVPLTPLNQAYIENQCALFLKGDRPVDFPQGVGEAHYKGVGTVDDISDPVGRRAMGLPIQVA
jgi:hypothetical protein